MARPVWLLSLDTDGFPSAPLTTAGLKSYFVTYGRTASTTSVELVHFASRTAVADWIADDWPAHAHRARAAARPGVRPVVGLSCYTWNTTDLLRAAAAMRGALPDLLVVAGGPQVQRADEFLRDGSVDVVVFGEGERAFTELLDCDSDAAWNAIPGIAYVETGERGPASVTRTANRPRTTDLDALPSALDVLTLRTDDGEPLYDRANYETVRGCPFRCSFCEWGTGAIGLKMYQYSPDRIARDLEQLVAGGISDIYLTDSNFGALPGDLSTAQTLVDLRQRTGRPQAVGSSWAKHATPRVFEIARMLHRHGLLKIYTLSLQTLTGEALKLSNRANMPLNDYREIARGMAADGIPVRTEIMWPLPGDTVRDLRAGIDELFAVFPDVTMYGYVLLPGTEFHDRREEYDIRTQHLSPCDGGRGDYVVSTFSCSRADAVEGYVLVAAQRVLTGRGVIPLTIRYLALRREVSASAVMMHVVRALIDEYHDSLQGATAGDDLAAFERAAALRQAIVDNRERSFKIVRERVADYVRAVAPAALDRVLRVLSLDEILDAAPGTWDTRTMAFDFAAREVVARLKGMELPDDDLLTSGHDRVEMTYLPIGDLGITSVAAWA